jgi:hypothetical protein
MYLISDEAPSTKKRATESSDENPSISDNGINNSNDKEEDMPPPPKKIYEPASSTNEELLPETTAAGRPKRTRR